MKHLAGFSMVIVLALAEYVLRFLDPSSFIAIAVLFLAVVRNPQVPYFLRFNVLQAILLDIVLVVVSLAFQLLRIGSLGFAGRTLANTVFLGMLVLLLFRRLLNTYRYVQPRRSDGRQVL